MGSSKRRLIRLVQASQQQAKLLKMTGDLALPARTGETLLQIARRANHCTLCGLHKGRTKGVFGEGNPKAKLMFIGEAPGKEEDLTGRPFVGEAGQLLTKIISAIGLARQEVYITNVVKCRPPDNRVPLPGEILSCQPYLVAQVEWVHPKIICTLGKTATLSLLKTEEPISKLRGRWFDFQGIKVMPTFHPAYLLRNPSDKKLVWEDMKKIQQALLS